MNHLFYAVLWNQLQAIFSAYILMILSSLLIGTNIKQFVFQVKKEEYFPGLVDPLADCLNRRIEVVCKKGQKIVLIFERYVSPLEKINNIMRSIRNS